MTADSIFQFNFGRSTPFIHQTEAAECGLACLAMIACYHGFETDLTSLRARISVSLKGMSLGHIVLAARELRLHARPIRANLAHLKKIPVPAILHWNLNHFVVLTKIVGNRAHINDPAVGEIVVESQELATRFTGVAIEFEPTVDFVRGVSRQSLKAHRWLRNIRGVSRAAFQLIALAIAVELMLLAAPALTQWIIDDALVAEDLDLLVVVCIGIFLIGICQTAFSAIRSWVNLVFATQVNLQWTSNLFAHLTNIASSYFEKRHLGDIVSRFGSLANIQQFLTNGLLTALLDGLMAICTGVLMLIYSVKLGLIAFGAVFLYAIVRAARFRSLRTASEGQLVRSARQQSFFLETLRGIHTIKIFNKQEDRRARYMKLVVDTSNSSVRLQRLSIVFQVANTTLLSLEGALVLWFGGKSVVDHTLTIGMLVAFISYKDQFTSRICSLIDKLFELKTLRVQTDRLSDIVLATLEPTNVAHPPLSIPERPTVEIRNLSFRYSDGEPWIVKNFSLRVEAGESVVLVGPSGCGKTTIIKILATQLTQQKGEFLVAGLPLSRLGLDFYRKIFGAVMQNDRLFAGSLAENISFFDPEAKDEEIQKAAETVYLHDEITRMPMGYHTLIGDMGTVLSGGQRQRLLLARALYKKPRILLLDEATSHLDVALEQKVNASIAALNMTRIIVAHRPQTIEASGRRIEIAYPEV